MSAGEHLSDEVLAQWHERFGIDIYEAVGMSEFSYYLCETKSRPIRPGSAGFAQPGHDIALLYPETLQPVPLGEEGVISVPDTDPGLFINYWNQPEETAKHKHDGWFITGDFARMDADGYIWFLGRKEDIIKMGEINVNPGFGMKPTPNEPYSIWLWKGGGLLSEAYPNGTCKHFWTRETYRRKGTDISSPLAQKVTPSEARKAGEILPTNDPRVYKAPHDMR